MALLAISSFGTLILLSCNIDPPVKFLIVIILVVQEINLVSHLPIFNRILTAILKFIADI